MGNKLFDIFNNWVEESNTDATQKIQHCKKITVKDICEVVLGYITETPENFNNPKAFYKFTTDVATAVADEYYWRWSTGVGQHDDWKTYEGWIPRVTARVIQEMIPGIINNWVCGVDEDSILLQNIIRRYNGK